MTDKPAEWCLFWAAPCLPSSEWASWAQAVFSALAVFAAIGVVWWQLHVAQQNALASAELAASGLLAVVDQSIAALQTAASDMQQRINGEDTPTSSLVHVAAVLGSVQLPSREDLLALAMGSKSAAVQLLRASNATRQIKTALEMLATVPMGAAVDKNTLVALLTPLKQLATDGAEQLKLARIELDRLSPK